MNRANSDIREALSGIPHYLVANRIGVSESTFGRMLRFELPQERKNLILRIAAELRNETSQRRVEACH